MIALVRTTICVALLSAGGAISSASATPLPDPARLPQQFMMMESPAEDMLEAIDSKQVGKLNKLYHELEFDMVAVNLIIETGSADDAQRYEVGLLNSWFDQIALELDEMDDLPALANAINQFSAQLVVATHVEHAYRKNIAWMDYLGREFLLLNKQPSDSPHHKALLSARKADLQATWLSVKAAMGTDADAVALIERVDPLIHGLISEARPDQLVVLAKKELELIDDIEACFHIN